MNRNIKVLINVVMGSWIFLLLLIGLDFINLRFRIPIALVMTVIIGIRATR